MPEEDDDIKTLIDQLKDVTTVAKKPPAEQFNLPKEDLEQFILNSAGKLIRDSMDTIDDIKQYVTNAPEPEDVHSLAELYKASTGAIEALNKLLLQQQKSNAQVAIKTMDIQAKQQLANNDNKKITFTREEIFKELINKGDIIETEPADLPEED